MVICSFAMFEEGQLVALGRFEGQIVSATYSQVSEGLLSLQFNQLPSKSDHNVEYRSFSVDSSKTTSRRLPELLKALTAAKKQQRSKAWHHRMLKKSSAQRSKCQAEGRVGGGVGGSCIDRQKGRRV